MVRRQLDINPNYRLQKIQLPEDGGTCIIIDDVLLYPQELVQFAKLNQHLFEHSPHNYYAGLEFPAPQEYADGLREFFLLVVREKMGCRRVSNSTCRFSIITLKPEQLNAGQRLPHTDSRADTPPENMLVASVLYLFDNPAMGGTGLFKGLKGTKEEREQWLKPYKPAYPTGSIGPFTLMYTIEPKWNRMVFYNGRVFHTPLIPQPELMHPDPEKGRLTMNCFYDCTPAVR